MAISVNITFQKPPPVHASLDFEHGTSFLVSPVHVLAISVNITLSKPPPVLASRQIVNHSFPNPLPVHASLDFEHGTDYFTAPVHDLALSVNISSSKPSPVHARLDFEHRSRFVAALKILPVSEYPGFHSRHSFPVSKTALSAHSIFEYQSLEGAEACRSVRKVLVFFTRDSFKDGGMGGGCPVRGLRQHGGSLSATPNPPSSCSAPPSALNSTSSPARKK